MSGSNSDNLSAAKVVISRVEELCSSDELSLHALQEKNKVLTPNTSVKDASSFYRACMNENITLDIIKCLLFTGVEKTKTKLFCNDDPNRMLPVMNPYAHPLHLCCYNENCPDEVVQLLLEKYPNALSAYALVRNGVNNGSFRMYIEGLPLHYYLARKSNVDVNTVKLLVGAYPQALLAAANDSHFAPIHVAVSNKYIPNLREILNLLLESEPNTVRLRDNVDQTPLHIACGNENMSLELFQFIYNAWPEAIRISSIGGDAPIHILCFTERDDAASLDILQFMLGADPTLSMIGSSRGCLPIRNAVMYQSAAFCKLLIDAYPESLRLDSNEGDLPIHHVLLDGERRKCDKADTVQYMLNIYPESIHMRDSEGCLPIHLAAEGCEVETIEVLLRYDPDAATKETMAIDNGGYNSDSSADEERDSRLLPLHHACRYAENHNLRTIQFLYDVYPEAILASDAKGNTPIDLARRRAEQLAQTRFSNALVMNFLHIQLAYARQAQDITAVTTADGIGQFPLHCALKDNASLGSIKLLVKGNPAAVRVADLNGVYPLHIACEFSSAKTVKYLVELSGDVAGQWDVNKDSPLHYACRRGNLGAIKYLLKSHAAALVSERNKRNVLPIHLLLDCGESAVDRQSVGYIETVWLLLLANPQVVMV